VLSQKLEKTANSLSSFLETGESKGPLGEVAAAAKSIRKAADGFNAQIKTIGSLESNPQQLLFGKSPQIPQYSGGH
jgi:hypothetical protein